MSSDGRRPQGRVTRRALLGTIAGAGATAAAAGWVLRTVPGASAAAAPRRGGTLKIAEVGEPLTLDTVASTADLTSTITLGIFEELFAFDAGWRIQPSPGVGVYRQQGRAHVHVHAAQQRPVPQRRRRSPRTTWWRR